MSHARLSVLELMAALAVMAILTAIALPTVQRMQLQAKRAELPLNVEGIDAAGLAYRTAHDQALPDTGWVPKPLPPKPTPDAVDWPSETGFDTLPWRPDGAVRCTYRADGGGSAGACDLDGRDEMAWYHLIRSPGSLQVIGGWLSNPHEDF